METSVVNLIYFRPTKPNREVESYYANNLLFSNYFCIPVMLPLNTPTDSDVYDLVKYRIKRSGHENHFRILLSNCLLSLTSSGGLH